MVSQRLQEVKIIEARKESTRDFVLQSNNSWEEVLEFMLSLRKLEMNRNY